VACALDAATGHMLWSTPLFAAHSSLPAIANGVVYLYGDADLFAIDASNGQILAVVNVPGVPQIGQPVVANGFVYVTGSNGRLYAYGLLQRRVALPCS
jgi:eukaryotic-like serine/threonine-protein kinase